MDPGYLNEVDRGDATWTPTAAVDGNVWAVDATAAAPGKLTGSCSLNFNNGATYANTATGAATSAFVIDATLAAKVTLAFHSWNGTDAAETDTFCDRRYVEASVDGFKTIAVSQVLLTDVAKGAWVLEAVDLGASAGKNFQVRFRFDSVDSLNNGAAVSGTALSPVLDLGSLAVNTKVSLTFYSYHQTEATNTFDQRWVEASTDAFVTTKVKGQLANSAPMSGWRIHRIGRPDAARRQPRTPAVPLQLDRRRIQRRQGLVRRRAAVHHRGRPDGPEAVADLPRVPRRRAQHRVRRADGGNHRAQQADHCRGGDQGVAGGVDVAQGGHHGARQLRGCAGEV